MLKGFKRFLMQGNLIVIAVGLVVALAFSTLIKAFTDNVITPLINAAGGGGAGDAGGRVDCLGGLVVLFRDAAGGATVCWHERWSEPRNVDRRAGSSSSGS